MKTKDVLENIAFVAPAQAKEPDHEVQMARSELYRAGKCAIDLHNMLKRVSEQQGLEGWVQAKITKAADYLESVYHYLDYEMKDQSIGEGAPVGGTGPVAPGAVPVGGALGASVSPAQAAAMAAKSRIDQKKQIEAKIKELEMQKQQLQRQLATAGQVQETTGAGAFASSIGGNGLGKSKDEVGSLFGGTYKTKKKKIREADKTRIEPPKLNWPEPQLPGPKDPTDPKNMRMGLDKSMIDPNEPLDPSTIRLTPADRIREGEIPGINFPTHLLQPGDRIIPGNTASLIISPDGSSRMEYHDDHPGMFNPADPSRLERGQWTVTKEDSDTLADINKKIDWHQKAMANANYKGVNNTHHKKELRALLAKRKEMQKGSKQVMEKEEQSVKEGSKTGPKFTGYWKGKDKNPPGSKMVGSN